MKRILIPVDGFRQSTHAVQALLDARRYAPVERVELLTVQAPVQGRAGLSRLLTRDMIDEFYMREGQEAMEETRKLLDVTGTDYPSHVAFGHVATGITGYARGH